MMNYSNPFLNPYGYGQQMTAAYPQASVQMPQQQVVRVSGENGARAYQIGANSSAMLLDESGTLVWLVTTDGAGYKTVTPYDITPHQAAQAPDFGSLENRIKRLEEIVNDSADSAAVRRRAKTSAAGETDDQPGAISRKPAADDEPDHAVKPGNEAGDGYREQVRWRRE